MTTLQEEPLPTIPIREFLERILEERDRLYNIRFEASKTAVDAALIAQKESVANAFLSSEKAIVKAEEAQKAYNIAHNDLSRKMDEQSKGTIPRPETMALLKAIEDRMESQRLAYEKSIDTLAKSISDLHLAMSHQITIDVYETRHSELQRQVNDLRESRSESGGAKTGARELWGYFVAISGIALALVFHFIK